MPDFPIVDAHLHLWDPGRFRYPWLAELPAIDRPFGLAELDRARETVELERAVFLQCDCVPEQSEDEAAWVLSLADADPRIGGVVAHAPLERGEGAREVVGRYGAEPRIKGVRRLLQGESDPEFCLRPDFVAGVRMLAEHGLSFDVCIIHPQLAGVIELARRVPEVSFVLDHLGKPDIRSGRLDPWREQLAELAALPNVWCKLSGLVTEADHEAWTPADLRPYIDHALECFGFARTMYGGDWPVATLATDYRRWVEVVDEAIAGSSDAEKRALFRDNALAFYRVG